ncbi:22302_t:CDS:1, partial [Cetraspora pellucida]
DCKETITVTFTPTITLCSTPTPTPKCCQSSGGPGWQNKFHTPQSANVFVIDNITTSQDCCNFCFNDPECLQWNS